MTIDKMMAEIRHIHPEADIYGWPGNWIVHIGQLYNTLSQSPEKHRAAELALQAVRKARPKPMTVAEAKEAVKAKHAKAKVMGMYLPGTGKSPYEIAIDYSKSGHKVIGAGKTEGQAWKAAAAAIHKDGS